MQRQQLHFDDAPKTQRDCPCDERNSFGDHVQDKVGWKVWTQSVWKVCPADFILPSKNKTQENSHPNLWWGYVVCCLATIGSSSECYRPVSLLVSATLLDQRAASFLLTVTSTLDGIQPFTKHFCACCHYHVHPPFQLMKIHIWCTKVPLSKCSSNVPFTAASIWILIETHTEI